MNTTKMFLFKMRLVGMIVFAICLQCSIGFAQGPQTARGVVLDENDQPLSGVRVIELGTQNATATNEKGEFFLRLRTKAGQVEVSHLGKQTQLVRITSNLPVQVRMKEELTGVDEVVVVGYGVQERQDLTGAISSIGARDFEGQPITDVNQAMLGQAAGVNVMNTSGTPGGGLDIQIRGISSIGSSNTPLYVVDGNIIQVSMDPDSNPLDFLNPADIESIDILKDASAAAIYGSRGSNGVVIVTTKSGREGRARLSYNVQGGVQEAFNMPEMLSGRDFALLSIEARNNTWVETGTGRSPLDSDAIRSAATQIGYFQDFLDSGKPGTNWTDAIFRQSFFQDHQLSASGGNNGIKYLISGGFLDNQGTMLNTGFQRYSARANVEAKVTNKLKLNMRFSPTYTNQDFLPSTGRFHEAYGGIVQAGLLMLPTMDIYDPDRYTGYSTAILAMNGVQNMENPVAKVNMIKDWRRNFNMIANGSAVYDVSKLFTFTLTGGTTIRSIRRDRLLPSTIGGYGIIAPAPNSILSNQSMSYNWQTSAQLNYRQRIGKHRLNGVAVHERQMQQLNTINANARDTWTDDLIVVDSNLENVLREGSSDISEWALSSWIARLNYNYDNRYLITSSIRADGSSKFADRWGIFPSAAVAWRASNERFLKDVSWLTDLKLRASYGVTGNNSVGNYQFMSMMGASGYVLGRGGENIVSGIRLRTYGNPNLTWEQTEQVDVGIDLAILKRRLALTVDYYDKQTKDLLLNVPVPSNMGYSSILTNIGRVQNRGIEFTLNTRNFVKAFQWNTDFNISFNRQKVIALGPEGDPLWGSSIFLENTHLTRIGDPMGLFFGLNVTGIYQNQQQVDELPGIPTGNQRSRPGDFIFENADDSDNVITLDDRTIVGNPHPKYVFGFRNQFAYKDFTLSIMMRGAYGADILNLNFGNTPYSLNSNSHVSAKGRWQSEEEPGDGKTPRLSLNTRAVLGTTTLNSSFIENASFLNIQNVTFGYKLPNALANRLKMTAVSAQLSVNNLYMFSDYTGFNPEGGMYTDTTLSPGLDWGRYPLSRVFTLGFNLTF